MIQYDAHKSGRRFVQALIKLLAQAGEGRPEESYLRRVGHAAKHSDADERTLLRVAARIVERWPKRQLSFRQALADVSQEEKESDFEYTKEDEIRLAKRRCERRQKKLEAWTREAREKS
jgi:hypothetical protein